MDIETERQRQRQTENDTEKETETETETERRGRRDGVGETGSERWREAESPSQGGVLVY